MLVERENLCARLQWHCAHQDDGEKCAQDLLICHTRQLFSEQGMSLTCAQSNVQWGIRLLDQCYQEAHEALKLKYIRGRQPESAFPGYQGA
ncbi:MAG: hypothetical protein ACLTBV_15985 [Enterocloster bolteae]